MVLTTRSRDLATSKSVEVTKQGKPTCIMRASRSSSRNCALAAESGSERASSRCLQCREKRLSVKIPCTVGFVKCFLEDTRVYLPLMPSALLPSQAGELSKKVCAIPTYELSCHLILSPASILTPKHIFKTESSLKI